MAAGRISFSDKICTFKSSRSGLKKKKKKKNREGERPGILCDAVPLNTANCTWQSPGAVKNTLEEETEDKL